MFFKQKNPYSMSQCSFTMRCSEDIDANVFHVKLRHFTNRWSGLTNDWQYFQPPQNNEKCTFLVWIENHLIQNCTSKRTVQCLSKLKHVLKMGATIIFYLWIFFYCWHRFNLPVLKCNIHIFSIMQPKGINIMPIGA